MKDLNNIRRAMLLAKTIPEWEKKAIYIKHIDTRLSLAERDRQLEDLQDLLRGAYRAFFHCMSPELELDQDKESA